MFFFLLFTDAHAFMYTVDLVFHCRRHFIFADSLLPLFDAQPTTSFDANRRPSSSFRLPTRHFRPRLLPPFAVDASCARCAPMRRTKTHEGVSRGCGSNSGMPQQKRGTSDSSSRRLRCCRHGYAAAAMFSPAAR
jgi:hypothetical protein